MSVGLLTRGMLRSCCFIRKTVEVITDDGHPEVVITDYKPTVKGAEVIHSTVRPHIKKVTED